VPRSLRPHRSRALVPALGALAAALSLSGWGAGGSTALAHAARSAAQAVTVSPLAGTPDASPSTQISFLGPAGTKVSDVEVRGSLSGHHAGRLEAYSTGTGESFIAARPFTAGERVDVSARVTRGRSSVTVATNFSVAFQAPVTKAQFPSNPGTAADVQHYLSAPSITPSTVTVTTPARSGATAGDFFLAPYQGAGAAGPMIVDQAGRLIWFHPLAAGEAATNFRVQRYDGEGVLTWWQGRILGLGFGQGEDEIYNSAYQPIARVQAGNGYRADLHQFELAAGGVAWIDAVDPVKVDLAGVGGARAGVVSDSVVQEIDVRTGLVMWEWHTLGHIPLRDSYSAVPRGSQPWYYAHLNSVDPGIAGTLLISARNTWAIYDVDIHSGAVVWRIGGRRSSFRLGPGATFHFQHDAAWQPHGLISVFDNGNAEESQSRGLLLDPDAATRTVTLVRQFTNPSQTLLTDSQGDLLKLPGGNWLMGYGGLPNFTEFSASARVLLDATLGPGVQDYRTYLARWSAQPRSAPAVAAQTGAGGLVTVEASWNGATAVSAWELRTGADPRSMSVAATVASQGFETTLSAQASGPDIAVTALSATGQTLATSATISPSA
jgi:Arylsulfotransferase (ASST)